MFMKHHSCPVGSKTANKLIRRDFLKNITLTGLSMTLINPASKGSMLFFTENPAITGEFFTLSFDQKLGLFTILRKDGTILLQNASACINTSSGKRLLSSGSYRHKVSTGKFSDHLGTGQLLKIVSEDLEHRIDFELRISIYNQREAVTIETICTNTSPGDCQVYSLEPVYATGENDGRLFIPGVIKCLTNGAMYYDAGRIHTFGNEFVKQKPYGETKGGRMLNSGLSPSGETVHTWWNAGFFSGYNKEGMVLGYVENKSGLGQLLISRTLPGEVVFLAESVFSPGHVLRPGEKLGSDKFVIQIGQDPYQALEAYASMAGAFAKARVNSIVNGWSNWFYTYEHISEDEVIRNAEFAAKYLKKYGLQYIQVDEGYQRWHGDWEGNERFPHGMKWLAERIRDMGLKAGIWVAPYVVSEPTGLTERNPDWFLKNPDGSLKRVGPWPDENTDWARNEDPKRYGLDITHPGAAQWLYDLIDKMANQWGYEMIKTDFVAWSLLSAHHFNEASVTPAQAYRKGYEIIRAAAGEKCHLLDCGPGAVSAGLINSMRIELDQNYGYGEDAWKQYFLHSASSSPAAAKRYYFHKRTWINDADQLCMHLLPVHQAQAAATLIALTGGNLIAGDRLTELDPVRMDILSKVFPSYGEAARPVDLFDTDLQADFALTVKKPFGEWTVACFINPDLRNTITRKYPLERLWLKPDKAYLVYDFWKESFFGEVSGEINLEVLPGSVTLLTLHEKSDMPLCISTSRHVLQGAIELEHVAWDTKTRTLSGISHGPQGSSHYITVYLPEAVPWKQSGHGLFRDYGAFSVSSAGKNILRVYLHFTETGRIEWNIQL